MRPAEGPVNIESSKTKYPKPRMVIREPPIKLGNGLLAMTYHQWMEITYSSETFSVFMAGIKVKTLITKQEATQPRLCKGYFFTNGNPYVRGHTVPRIKIPDKISR